jgi:hypothetical protein
LCGQTTALEDDNARVKKTVKKRKREEEEDDSDEVSGENVSCNNFDFGNQFSIAQLPNVFKNRDIKR